MPLEELSSSDSVSLLCSIQIPVTILPSTQCSLFWDISSNLNATVQFLIDSVLSVVVTHTVHA